MQTIAAARSGLCTSKGRGRHTLPPPVAPSPSRWFPTLHAALASEEQRAFWQALGVSLALPVALGVCLPTPNRSVVLFGFGLLLALFVAASCLEAILAWRMGQRSSASVLASLLLRLRPLPVGVPTGEDFLHAGLRQARFPVVTFLLVSLNCGFPIWVSDHAGREQFVHEFGALSLQAALGSSLLHGSIEHWLGNMLFLWAFGSMLEPRIGGARLFACYFLCAIGSALASEWYYTRIFELPGSSLGASGAIAGLMGLAMVRLYSTPVSISAPLLGPLGFFAPIGYRVHLRIAWLVVAFVVLDLSSARDAASIAPGGVDHAAHLGGYLAGVALAHASGLFRAGRDEALRQHALAPHSEAALNGNRAELRRWIAQHPGDVEATLHLARLEAQPFRRAAGEAHYRSAIRLLRRSDRIRAGEVYLEYFRAYGGVFPPAEQTALSRLLRDQGHGELAARTLETSLRLHPRDDRAHAAEREEALYILARLHAGSGRAAESGDFLRRLHEEFPGSALLGVGARSA